MASKIVIIGAGISGLAAAWFLKQKHGREVDITIVEKSSRVGGWIQSDRTEGFLFEKGPRSCRTKGNGRETLELIESLGLQGQVITAHSSANQRYLYVQKQLQKIPSSFWKIPFSPLLKGWLGVALHEWKKEAGPSQDQSIYDFFSRRIGKEWTERFIDPVVSGIYAGDIRRLSIQSCFPLLFEREQCYGSLLKGALKQPKKPLATSSFVSSMEKHPLFSFKEGMETLPRRLSERLDGNILLNHEMKQVASSRGRMRVYLSHDVGIEADYIISTVPLDNLTYVSVVVVNVGYRKPVLRQKGFGYLIPSSENEAALGCVFDSCVFPEQNQAGETRLTVMLGGMHHPEVSEWSSRECLAFVQSALSRHLGIDATPDAISVTFARQAIPQFEVGHLEKIKQIPKNDHYHYLGSAFSGVAVNDCIAEAKKLALNLPIC